MKPKEYHELFADRVIEQMKAGTAPWMKPWTPGESTGSPMNFSTGRHYRGGNHLFLAMSGFSDPRWGTFKQIRAGGGCVSKGSKGSPILFFGRSSHALRDEDGKVVKNDDGKTVYVESRHGPAIHKPLLCVQRPGAVGRDRAGAPDPSWGTDLGSHHGSREDYHSQRSPL